MYTPNNIKEKLEILYLFAYMYIGQQVSQPGSVIFIGHQWDKLGDAMHCTAGILPASETQQKQAGSRHPRDGTDTFPAFVTKYQQWPRGV